MKFKKFGFGSGSGSNCAARVGSGQMILVTGQVRASILSPCRTLMVAVFGIIFVVEIDQKQVIWCL